jgi:hypothetical protein
MVHVPRPLKHVVPGKLFLAPAIALPPSVSRHRLALSACGRADRSQDNAADHPASGNVTFKLAPPSGDVPIVTRPL